VWWAEGGMQDEQVHLQQLQGLAREEVLVVKLQPKRSDQTLAPMQGAAFSWFWGTLWRFRHFYVESMVATVVAVMVDENRVTCIDKTIKNRPLQ
jgi:ATP-binding cassette subfamily C protein LapB